MEGESGPLEEGLSYTVQNVYGKCFSCLLQRHCVLGTGKYPDVLKMIVPETTLDPGQGLLNGPLSKHFIPVSATRGLCWFRDLSSQEKTASHGKSNRVLLTWKLKLTPGHLGVLIPLNQEARRQVLSHWSDW